MNKLTIVSGSVKSGKTGALMKFINNYFNNDKKVLIIDTEHSYVLWARRFIYETTGYYATDKLTKNSLAVVNKEIKRIVNASPMFVYEQEKLTEEKIKEIIHMSTTSHGHFDAIFIDILPSDIAKDTPILIRLASFITREYNADLYCGIQAIRGKELEIKEIEGI